MGWEQGRRETGRNILYTKDKVSYAALGTLFIYSESWCPIQQNRDDGISVAGLLLRGKEHVSKAICPILYI